MAEGKRFINKVNVEMRKHNLRALEYRGSYNQDIKSFSFGYLKRVTDMDVETSRNLFVEAVEKIYELTNNEKNLVPYLRHFPYDENTGFIAISFCNMCGNDLPISNISCVSVYKGVIEYSKRNENGFEGLFRENYSTAYEKVYGKPLIDRKVMYGVEAIEETKQ